MIRRERKPLGRSVALLIASLLLNLIGVQLTGAMLPRGQDGQQMSNLVNLSKPAAVTPCSELRVHKVGNIHLSVTNYGIFGNQADPSIIDPETGQSAESCVFPAGSSVEYLFQGALWIGAVVGEDTLCSTGNDGWMGQVFEMYPNPAPEGCMIKRSIRKTDPSYSPEAISEADYIAVYYDTLTDTKYVSNNPDDNRPHIPLGLEIQQKSYSWSYSYAEDFVLLDFVVKNIGLSEIRRAYLGIYIDADVYDLSNTNGFQDDICGFRTAVPSDACKDLQDTINVAWIADNDGDPQSGSFNKKSPTAVTGTRVVRSPNPDLKLSFNWWVSNGEASLDWGPVRAENDRNLGTGGLGTPAGDRNKYYFMKNREFDYDQLWSNVDFTNEGWLPPNTSIGKDLADGYDTRYLLSFGPFDMLPGDSLPVTMGYIGGDNFHVRPDNFQKYFNADKPEVFNSKLDFTDLGINSKWAAWVYDNPGVDTDTNGDAGVKIANPCVKDDSIYVSGDGIPDFAGPPPPPPPQLKFAASPGKITISWNGKESETSEDPFSFVQDFEGYRVYMADQPQLDKFALLTSYDHNDYNRYRLNRDIDPPRWELKELPFAPEDLEAIYRAGDALNPPVPDFDLDNYPSPLQYLPWIENVEGTNVETGYYFVRQDYNRDSLNIPGAIKRVNYDRPEILPTDSTWEEDLGKYVWHYYDYEYSIEGLLPSRPVYLAVTTIDFGNPLNRLEALESSPLANAIQVYPIWSADEVAVQKLDVAVFPNPYKVNAGYVEAGYEDPNDPSSKGSPDWARRIHFANLPKKATIRIYTLDGDLVRELQHPCGCILQEGESMVAWDLISQNTQAVASGIYLYSVESELGNQVGKFVIIK